MEISNNVDDEIMEEEIHVTGEPEIHAENLEQETFASEIPQEQEIEDEIPVEEDFEKTVIAGPSDMPVETVSAYENSENMVEEPQPAAQESIPQDLSEAEGFVKGIFNGITDIDERLKAVEITLSERKLNGDFALRYLEDILDEYDSMDKIAVKSRIEYLIADLKK